MGKSVTPLCGVYAENAPLSYLLSVDGFNILLDCGWNDHLDPSLLVPLSRVASTIDAVLLSHSDTLHLGALPYAIKHFGLSAPVYATKPVFELGLLTMLDHYHSRKEFDLFTIDDINTAFRNGTRLNYSQSFRFSGKGEGVVITPHVAGHLLGGTVWNITKDGEEVIYAVDFNHSNERHLNGTVLESFVSPAVLITDAYNAFSKQTCTPQREQDFLEVILNTLRDDGNVLLPVDTAGRVLELLLILEQHWKQHDLPYPILFLSHVSTNTLYYVKSALEWIPKSSELHPRDNAFRLKYVDAWICKDQLPHGPKIVLASMASLEVGPSRDLFKEWAADIRNLVLFTERGQFGTRARSLQSDLGGHAKVNDVYEDMGSMPVCIASLRLDTPPASVVISSELTVQHKCKMVYMDFEGRSDGQSIKSILARVAPLKLVLVHGSAEATEHLKQHCLEHVCPHVYAPQLEEMLSLQEVTPGDAILADLKQCIINKYIEYINCASVDELRGPTLPGIGAAKCDVLLECRADKPFESVKDIIDRAGISENWVMLLIKNAVGHLFENRK